MNEVTSPKLTSLIRKSTTIIEGILPFKEKPSKNNFLNKSNEEGYESNGVEAYDLFSLFTADIIKEEVIFTR
ncbi:MAG: hypothetical protein M3Z26_02700 [Bacteroidota bacterium]|nr:hypothetical protein [Bacteroidota bacterium]